jgi:hypothetical protein
MDKKAMRNRLVTIVAILLAVIGWWGIYELTGKIGPDQPGAQAFFFALLLLALTGTLIPPAAYLNRRFAPEAYERDPWRFLRHAFWAGTCLTSWAWLQTHRTFNLGLALVIALIFVAIEIPIMRLREQAEMEPSSTKPKTPKGDHKD